MTTFENLIKDEKILVAINDQKFTAPTEIQEKAIPLILDGKNIIAESATGTGKTIAFLAGLLSVIEDNKKLQTIVIVPTRELAIQIFDEIKKFTKFKELKATAIYGGASISNQINQLRNTNIVVGTPGRIIDLIERKKLKLETIKHVVLDEADRMCDMGFLVDISKIIEKTPKDRQILLFSATITDDVSGLEKKYLPLSTKIKLSKKIEAKKLIQEYYIVRPNQKFSLLLHLVKKHNRKTIIFSNTRNEVDVLYDNFKEHKVDCFKLHGGLDQNKRTSIIFNYHKDKNAVLIASDVAARGLHIDNLDYIYNYDLPKDNKQYVHRIGRTARAGKTGKAISIITQKEEENYLKMGKEYKYEIVFKELPNFPNVPIRRAKKTDTTTVKKEDKNRYSERRKHFNKSKKERQEINYTKKINKDFTKEEKKEKHKTFSKHKKKIKQKKYFKR